MIVIWILALAGLGLMGWSAVGGFSLAQFAAGAVLLILGGIAAGLYERSVKLDCPECGRRGPELVPSVFGTASREASSSGGACGPTGFT